MGLGPPAVSEEQMELPREKKLQVGHLSSALLLLFLQQESLSSGGRKKEFGMLWALLLQLDRFILFLGPQR